MEVIVHPFLATPEVKLCNKDVICKDNSNGAVYYEVNKRSSHYKTIHLQPSLPVQPLPLTTFSSKTASFTVKMKYIPSANLFSSSVFPMAFAAWHICRSSSSRRLMQRIMLPV